MVGVNTWLLSKVRCASGLSVTVYRGDPGQGTETGKELIIRFDQ